jgi:hypothetical protein
MGIRRFRAGWGSSHTFGLMVVAMSACGGVADPSGTDGDSSADAASGWDADDAAVVDARVGDGKTEDMSVADSTARDATSHDSSTGEAAAPDSEATDAHVAADAPVKDASLEAALDAAESRDVGTLDSTTLDAADALPPGDAAGGTDSGSPGDACVDSVLCVLGTHWDPTVCMCVTGACVSLEGGPCGGFTSNPCTCASNLACVDNPIPDIPGTCEPLPVCDPIPCDVGQTWDSTLCECSPPACTTGADCTGPLPKSCMVCLDGGNGCAQWGCSAGACVIEYCP